MRKLLVISTMIVLTLTLPVHSNAQNQVRSVSAGGTPMLPDNLVKSPVPRLPDGKPDLTGPWVGGGRKPTIEREAGLKPADFPLRRWRKDLRAKRREQADPYPPGFPL